MTPFVDDGDFQLYVGDVRQVLRELPDASVDCVVTSPPYLDARPEYPSLSLEDFEAVFSELARIVTGSCLVNVGRLFRARTEKLWWVDLLRATERAGWSLLDTLVWVKPNANPIHGEVFADSHEYVLVLGEPGMMLNTDAVRRPHADSTQARFRRGWTNHKGVKNPIASKARKTRAVPNPAGALPRSYIEVFVGGDKGNKHPAPMALGLAEHLVRLASWSGETVLDPFAGSGTTCLAARKLGRHSVGIELNPSYAAMCARRLQQLSLLAEGAA